MTRVSFLIFFNDIVSVLLQYHILSLFVFALLVSVYALWLTLDTCCCWILGAILGSWFLFLRFSFALYSSQCSYATEEFMFEVDFRFDDELERLCLC